MASLRTNDTNNFETTSDLRQHYGSIRDRLRSGPEAKLSSAAPVTKAPPNTASADARSEGLAAATAPPDALAEIPIEIRDVVIAVASLMAISPFDLLSDLGKTASFGRRVAAALVVRRSQISARDAAKLFGIAIAVVDSASVTLDAALAATQASATHAPLVPLAKIVVAEWPRFEEPVRLRVTIAEIQETVARVYRCSVEEMKSARRMDNIVAPRHVAMYLARRFTPRSLPEIGNAFARDHSTAFSALRKIQPHADAVAGRLTPRASVEDWARALREQMQ